MMAFAKASRLKPLLQVVRDSNRRTGFSREGSGSGHALMAFAKASRLKPLLQVVRDST